MTEDSHPTSLPWFIAGRLDPAEAGRVQAHLATCAECRDTAERLSSIGKTLIRHRGTPHVAAGDLVAFAKNELTGDALARQRVERHLDDCTECRDDLASLSAPDAGTDVPIGNRSGRFHWIGAAALVVVLLGGGICWSLLRTSGKDVTFLPPRRGLELSGTLAGPGPWRLKIMLPFEAPAGDYDMEVRGADGTRVAGVPDSIVREDGGTASATIPSLPGPGLYRMTLTPHVATPEAPFHYMFLVADDPRGRP